MYYFRPQGHVASTPRQGCFVSFAASYDLWYQITGTKVLCQQQGAPDWMESLDYPNPLQLLAEGFLAVDAPGLRVPSELAMDAGL